MSRRFGLLGRKLGHSWSPQIHEMLCGYEYGLYETEPESLASFLRETDLAGMNVTIPYKKDVVPFCTELSPSAKAIGSVNTLVRREDGWFGDNTDYAGFTAMVKHCGVSVKGRKTLVFGTGGASLAVIAALRDLGACPIVNISRSGPDNYGNISIHRDAEILVNTTPLGMYPHTGVAPVNIQNFPACKAVLDVVYNPLRTRFLMDAEALGIPCAGGLLMLVEQARRSAEQFSQTSVPDSRVTEIVSALAAQMENIVLIGMPGCGKSAVGKRLAPIMGREFVDADELLAEKAGMTIPDIFSAEGEEGFRRRETAILEDLGKRSGLIIATGGGCVTRPENYPLLHQNGRIFWIQRDLNNLPTDGRPLSQQNSLHDLYERRKDLYAAFADHTVVSDEDFDHTIENIREAFV